MLKQRVYAKVGKPHEEDRLTYESERLQDHSSLWEYQVEEDSTIRFVLILRGGKPVIYLFPPSPLKVHVKLPLAPEWSFESIYPVVDVHTERMSSDGLPHQSIQWLVHARPNGDLTELTSDTDISYLFWEAL